MSYADDFEDIGGDMANYDYQIYLMEQRDIQQSKRNKNIIGRYIIAIDGKSGVVYMQDRSVSKASFWTKYIGNALGYIDKSSAITKAKSFKYNNPRVYMVASNYKLELVS